MKKAQATLLLMLFLSSIITANAAEAEVDTTHIVCLESFPGTMTLGNVYLDCYLNITGKIGNLLITKITGEHKNYLGNVQLNKCGK